jgi:hypothetical protein
MAEHLGLVQSLQLVVVVVELTTQQPQADQEILQAPVAAAIQAEVAVAAVAVALVRTPEAVVAVLVPPAIDHPEFKLLAVVV